MDTRAVLAFSFIGIPTSSPHRSSTFAADAVLTEAHAATPALAQGNKGGPALAPKQQSLLMRINFIINEDLRIIGGCQPCHD